MTKDIRIPVRFGGTHDDAAYLLEGRAAAPAGAYGVSFTLAPQWHGPGCACCAPGRAVVAALAGLHRAMVTGAAAPFRCVVVRASATGEAAVRAALAQDALVRARFREV
jgi:hypothetical protein